MCLDYTQFISAITVRIIIIGALRVVTMNIVLGASWVWTSKWLCSRHSPKKQFIPLYLNVMSILLLVVVCQGAEEATWLSSKASPTFISGTNFYLGFNITCLAIVPTLSQNLSKPTDKCARKLINTPVIQAINVTVMNWETFLQFYLRSLVVLGAYYLQAWMYTRKESNCLKGLMILVKQSTIISLCQILLPERLR